MKAKVVWISDGCVSTGFARVAHSIHKHLPDEYEIHHLAVNYRGDPYPAARYPAYPAMTGGDILGIGRVKSLLEFVKPDLVFILNDAWVITQYLLIGTPSGISRPRCLIPTGNITRGWARGTGKWLIHLR